VTDVSTQAATVEPHSRTVRWLRHGAPAAAGRGLSWLTPVLATVAIVAILQFLVVTGIIDQRVFPRPTSIGSELWDHVQQGTFWESVLRTLEGWALGLGLATVLAVPLGIAIGSSSSAYRSVRFIVDFVRPIPSIALLPLFILLFGIGMSLKTYLVALGCFFPLFFQTMYGVQDVDPVARDTARAYGLKRGMRFFYISLPGATPYIATGLRIAAVLALLTSVGSELIVGLPGLGFRIFKAQYAGQTSTMYALITTSGLIGLLITFCFNRLERVTLKWHPSQRPSDWAL
jgi:ABC-type nitrate/sulfonate/bicarbonate transport system permease component